MQRALGSVEVRSLVGALEAADVMVKTADVVLASLDFVGSGIVAAVVEGEVAAVSAAVESGSAAAGLISEVIATNVIPRPVPEVHKLLRRKGA
ncbi:MAG: BMC domain-containing protein [Synergistaceae bacterium]|nr:BMC domain-containing protein [Synergistaceae bacterium]